MGLIDKVLGSIVKVIHSGATKELADKDPQFKKDHEIMQELQKKIEHGIKQKKNLTLLSKKLQKSIQK